MVIQKVINNNTVITLNETGEETILMGRGIGFAKKPGDKVKMTAVDKTFVIHSADVMEKFKLLLQHIPTKYFLLSEQIIERAKSLLGQPLSESIYITLPDHIASSVERHKKGIVLPNLLLIDICQFYPKEFEIGLLANRMIATETGIQPSEDEAGFIAMHFVTAELGGSIQSVYKMTALTQKIVQMVLRQLKFEPDKTSIHYYRFLTHIKFLAHRIVSGTQGGNDMSELLEGIGRTHAEAFDIAEALCNEIEREQGFHSGDNEKLYLTIHVARLLASAVPDGEPV